MRCSRFSSIVEMTISRVGRTFLSGRPDKNVWPTLTSSSLRLLRHRRHEADCARIRGQLSAAIHLVRDREPESGEAGLLTFHQRHRLRSEIALIAQTLHVI